MANPLPWSGRIALLLVLPAVLLPLLFAGPRSSVPAVQPSRQSRFHDWTTHHVLYPRFGTVATLEAARRDPRALFRWRESDQREFAERQARWLELQPNHLQNFFRSPRRIPPGRFPGRSANDIHADWNISLGAGTTPPGQFPAKYSFNTTAPPDCTKDFVVFPVNVAGSGTQPNIIAFNNLYTGTAGGNGICNRTVTGNDAGTSAPTVNWSYNVHALTNGTVATSPVLSLDGTKVAFVESVAGSAAHFHVLAWNSGDGRNANLQSLASTKAITTFSATAPAAASGTATDLQLGAAAMGTDTLSSPYVDYFADTAYVGNDAGVLFRIKNVFCTNPSCGTAIPSLDTTWGSAGSVTVCAGKLTGPIQDFYTQNIFVGCANGKVYGFNSSGSPLATASISVGDGSLTGAVVESPVVDGASGFIYAVSGTGAAPNTTHAVTVQAKTNLSATRVAIVGVNGFRNLHAPAFNDPYFSSNDSTTWLIYTGAFDATAANLTLYASTFDASRNMTAGAPTAAHTLNIGSRPEEYAPLLEFKNTNDWLFFGILIGPPNFARSNINAFPTGAPTQPGTGLPGTSTGTSGMVVDNVSASAQASSLYFASRGDNHALKYTQANLN